MYLRSLSVHTDICPSEGSIMTCSMSFVNMSPARSTCSYFKHLHIGNIVMVVMFQCLVSLSVGNMAFDAKYAQTSFEQ